MYSLLRVHCMILKTSVNFWEPLKVQNFKSPNFWKTEWIIWKSEFITWKSSLGVWGYSCIRFETQVDHSNRSTKRKLYRRNIFYFLFKITFQKQFLLFFFIPNVPNWKKYIFGPVDIMVIDKTDSLGKEWIRYSCF